MATSTDVAGSLIAPPSPYATPSVVPTEPDNPAVTHPAYARMRVRWEKCRALMLGSEAIRDGQETFLPRYASESDDDYAIRVQAAALYNGFSRVVLASVGMLLQHEPELGADMPQPIKDFWENVDGAKTHGAVFTADMVMNAIVDGSGGILTDYANPDSAALDRSKASAAAVAGVELSGDDEQLLGLRPYWIYFKADDVIKPIYQTVNGVKTLVLLILRESIDERKGQFGVMGVVRYRVYTNDNGVIRFQLWKVPLNEVRPVLAEPPRQMQNVTKIPWSPLRTGRKLSDVETVPPLMDLAELNLQHHRVQTNLISLEDLACVPTQVRIGAQPNEEGKYPAITLGPRSTIEAPKLDGVAKPVYWHSPDVTVLEPARKTLEATEAAMGAMGLAFLAPQTRATETAQAKRIDSTAQNATLATVGRATQDCLEMASGFVGDFLQVKAGSIAVNNEFENLMLDAPTMLAYIAAVATAGFPPRLLVEAWQAGGRIPDSIDVEALLTEMETNLAAAADAKAQAQSDALAMSGQQPAGGKTPAGMKIVRDKKTGKAKKLVPA